MTPPRKWRLLETWEIEPGLAMAVDEALLENPEAPPTLRFYSFAPDTLSLGYFQRAADVPARDRASAQVRRMTGGGAIHHDARELTFSIATGEDDPLYRGPLAASYQRVHAALAACFRAFGVDAHLRGSERLASDRPGTGMCFHASTPLDLVWDGRKGVGSAQRRKGARVLHHGSIKLEPTELDQGVAALRRYREGLTAAALARELGPALARVFDLELVPAGLTEPEWRRARERASFFRSQAFVGRR